jgi:dCMP deaminase
MYERNDYLTWDEYFMSSAILTSLRSKDPNTQVGCCIVNEDNVVLSQGYNGTPVGWKDEDFPWAREGENLSTKYPYVVHSEANAITHCVGQGMSLKDSRIYVTLFPCNECAKAIIQAGIKTVIYADNKYDGTPSVEASKRLMTAAGVKFQRYEPTGRKITIEV